MKVRKIHKTRTIAIVRMAREVRLYGGCVYKRKTTDFKPSPRDLRATAEVTAFHLLFWR